MEDDLVTGTGRRYGHLVRPVAPTPQRWQVVDPPRAAIAEAECYDGTARIFEVDVVARAPGVLLVEQPDDGGWGENWLAWVPAECVQAKP